MRKFPINIIPMTLLLGIMLLAWTKAHAEDPLVIDSANNSVVTGVVESISGDKLYIDVNGTKIEVDADELSVDENLDAYFPVGTKITVTGQLEDSDEIEAKKIIRVENAQPTVNLNTDN